MVPTKTLSVQILTEIVLSPHDLFMAGILPGSSLPWPASGGRQDGAGDANFNVLPDTKTTLAAGL